MWWKATIVVILTICFLFGMGFAIILAAYPLKHQDAIKSASTEFDIEPDLIASIIRAESGFRHNVISSKGAVGLMQLMPSTARWIAQSNDIDLTDPETNIRLGTKYLRYLFDRFGDLRTVLIAYNAGEGKVAGWLKEKGLTTLETSPYPATNAYVERVLGSRWIYRLRL
ncbi:MAG: lytic transglycosylase domain-containing protein [Firmicutes bacterium]|nr:lytic transglycosylase domain-containing protein [Bacillota bacterium]